MLSIGKLAAGQAKYYLEQADDRVDVVESVGRGVEDYYVGGREARGEWIGAGARELSLAGGVDGSALRRVLAGLDPEDGASLRSSASAVRVAGFDLTFSAPKSVSVVFGIGDTPIRDAARRAHDRAVREAVGYLEATAAAVRRGAGGARVELADGLVAAAFRHRTSRVGDPQLHTHVLVANLGRGPDGRWSALDGRRLYAEARAASFVYQAVLRAELTRELGLEWLPVRQGIAELAGVPKPMLRALAGRAAGAAAGARPRAHDDPDQSRSGGGGLGRSRDRAARGSARAGVRRDRGAHPVRPLGRGREIAPGSTILAHVHRSAGFDVYDAWNEPRGCRVIVKTLRPDRLGTPGARRKLLREGRLLKRLTHPHIVRAYEVHDGPRPAVIMETLTGQTVDHLIVEGLRPLSSAELANLGAHLAAALRHLHGEGFLHLDLKPSNVVAESGRAKVIDLSHARPPGRMRAGNGTWCYMAPEQARGGEVDAAADVWGLGIVLYAAATRTNPLAEIAEELDVDEPQLHSRLPPLRRARPRLPAELSMLIDACLELEPGARPGLDDVLTRLYAIT